MLRHKINLKNPSRRSFLKLLAASGIGIAGGASVFGAGRILLPAETLSLKTNIVIAGCGLAGLAAASRLRRQLPNAQITLIDAKEEHDYQPGYIMAATGIWKDDARIRSANKHLIPEGVNWVQEMLVECEPEQNQVITASGKRLNYDFLIVATGLQQGYDQIEGMDERAFGLHGLGSAYHSMETAFATWHAMDRFRQKGGRAVMTLPSTFIKCSGAPLKMTFMLSDRLHEQGTHQVSQIDFFAPRDRIFGVKEVNDHVLTRWKTLPVSTDVHYHQSFFGVDIPEQVAYFKDADGNVSRESYDFLHVVPPMFAPDAIRNSPLAVAEGEQQGWLDVHKETLQHTRYPNVFGLGDVNGTPKGKTAATIKKSAPIVVHNLLQVLQGKAPDQVFNGYTSCPMLTRKGSALLLEFDGEGKMIPTLPFIDPFQDSYLAWFLEEQMLQSLYLSVLKGRA